MKENEQNDNLLNKDYTLNNQNEIKDFKNDIIFHMHLIENNLKNLVENKILKMEQLSSVLNEKYIKLNEKNKALSDLVSTIKYTESNMEKFEDYKKNTEYKLTSINVKLNNNEKNLNETNIKLDKIMIDQFTIPNLLGPNCKYTKTNDFLYWLNSDLNITKKQISEMKNEIEKLKKKQDDSVPDINQLFQSSVKSSNIYTDKRFKDIEALNDNLIKNLNEKVMEVRIENCKETMKLQENSNNLLREIENLDNYKKEISELIEEKIGDYKTEFEINNAKYEESREEFKEIKLRFGKMVDFLKDIKFKRALNEFVNPPAAKQNDSPLFKKQFVNKKYIRTLTQNLKFNDNKLQIDSDDLEDIDIHYNPKENESNDKIKKIKYAIDTSPNVSQFSRSEKKYKTLK
jgi:hypothetical protein